jgi:hypothetical protein
MRPYAGLALCSLLTFPSILACSHPEPIAMNEPGLAVTAPPAVFVEQRSAPLPGFLELGPACPAELATAPTAFFREQVLIRLPLGIEREQVQGQFSFARSERPLAMGCEPKLAASVFVSRTHSFQDLVSAREQLFVDLNFPSEREVVVVRGSDSDADVSMSISFPDHPAWGPSRVYLRTFTRYGHVHAVGFITERGSYHQLEPVFAASAASMLAVPQ